MTQLESRVRWSHLRLFSKSALHYRAAVTGESRADSSLMLKGRAIDAFVFGGAVPAVYEGRRQGKAWKKFQQEHADAPDIITASEHDTARRVADAILANETAAEVLQGQRLAEVDWRYGDRACVSHPDLIGDGFVTDLKTTNCAEPRRFTRHALWDFMYHTQLAFYAHAVQRAQITVAKDLYIVAAEYQSPFAVTVLRLSDRSRELGERQIQTWFDQLLVCEQSDAWPTYSSAIVELDLPDEDDFGLTFETADGDEISAA